jgi:hypothetical protein
VSLDSATEAPYSRRTPPMTPVDQFLHSVQESFAANRSTDWTKMGLFTGAAIALSLGTSVWIRRRRSHRELAQRIHSVLAGAGLSSTDLDDLTRIAAAGQLPVLEIMTVLAPFEHATAMMLADEAPTLRPIGGSWFERVRRLRKALGFSPLSAHLWLLSTRELVAGDSVATGGISGHVAEVNEASFAVDWPMTAVLAEGSLSTLTIDRLDDARYVCRVRLLSAEAVPEITTESGGGRSAGRRAFFAHDEQPERQQDREHIRLRINAAVRVRIIDRPTKEADAAPAPGAPSSPIVDGAPATTPATPASTPASMIAGTIADVSAGGLSLNLPVSTAGALARGVHVLCWFTLDGHATFEALAAVVEAAGAATGPPPGEQHLRLSFVALVDAERDRLAAAVAKHQSAPPPAATDGKA